MDGKAPALIVALRGDPELHQERLQTPFRSYTLGWGEELDLSANYDLSKLSRSLT